MTDNNNRDDVAHSPADEQLPLMQRILDNPFLLLVLGIVVPTVFYIIWGVVEILQIPIAD